MSAEKLVKSTPKRIGYARVSTEKQTLYQYVDALKAAGCDRIFKDFATKATAKNRKGLQRARTALQPGDTFVVLAIDRAFRSTIEGLLFLQDLHKDGITFHSIYQNVDTRTPEGWKWFCYAAADAEYERAVISRRTREKMAAAKRRGQHLGRPFKLSEDDVHSAHQLIAERQADIEGLASELRVAPVTIRRALDRYGLEAG